MSAHKVYTVTVSSLLFADITVTPLLFRLSVCLSVCPALRPPDHVSGVPGPAEEHDLPVRPRHLPAVRRPNERVPHLPQSHRAPHPPLLVTPLPQHPLQSLPPPPRPATPHQLHYSRCSAVLAPLSRPAGGTHPKHVTGCNNSLFVCLPLTFAFFFSE